MRKMKTSETFNKFLFYSCTIVASVALLVLVINVFYFDSSVNESLNIGLFGIYLSMMLVTIVQHFEIKQKQERKGQL